MRVSVDWQQRPGLRLPLGGDIALELLKLEEALRVQRQHLPQCTVKLLAPSPLSCASHAQGG